MLEVFDGWANSSVPVSTALEMERAVPVSLESYSHGQGFDAAYAGDEEGFILQIKLGLS